MKNLPLLEVGQAYLAQDFEYFEYDHVFLNEGKATLRIHLKNGTTIGIHATDEQLRFLRNSLNGANLG